MATNVNIRPLNGYVLVLPIKTQTPNASGIVLADSAQSKNRAIVIHNSDYISSVDKPELVVPVSYLKEGDIVYVADYVDKPVIVNNETYFFVKAEDILGVEDVNTGKTENS